MHLLVVADKMKADKISDAWYLIPPIPWLVVWGYVVLRGCWQRSACSELLYSMLNLKITPSIHMHRLLQNSQSWKPNLLTARSYLNTVNLKRGQMYFAG